MSNEFFPDEDFDILIKKDKKDKTEEDILVERVKALMCKHDLTFVEAVEIVKLKDLGGSIMYSFDDGFKYYIEGVESSIKDLSRILKDIYEAM